MFVKAVLMMTKFVFLLMLVSSTVLAGPDLSISGFGTIGGVATDSDEFGYRADFSKPSGVFKGDLDFAESTTLGIQLDIIANDEIDMIVQAVYRDQEELNLDTVLNLAFIRYAPSANWSFRLGRTAYDLFLLTDYRDIGYAYTWAHVPSEIYGVIPHRYLDGVDVTYSQPIGDLTFSAKLFYGENEFAVTAFNSPDAPSFRFDNIIGLALDFQSINWDVAVNHTQLKFDSQAIKPLVVGIKQLDALVPNFSAIWPNAVDFVNAADLDNRRGTYTSVSGQYRFDTVTVMSELAKINTDSLSVQGVESGYLSGIYHRNAHNFFASIAFSQSEKFDLDASGINLPALAQVPSGLEAYSASKLLLNYYSLNQKTVSVGWRWDFEVNMSFKLQVDHTRIDKGGSTFWQPPIENDTTDNRTGHVNALFANLSFLY
ncbi:MAG: hypothetical protein ACJAXM_001268 [Arenicella sp.]|jgi:hypothetical protein